MLGISTVNFVNTSIVQTTFLGISNMQP